MLYDYNGEDIISVHILPDCKINLAEVFHDITEAEISSETEIKQKIIEAMKKNGISDKQIENIINSIDD
jgi:hypothetical protein